MHLPAPERGRMGHRETNSRMGTDYPEGLDSDKDETGRDSLAHLMNRSEATSLVKKILLEAGGRSAPGRRTRIPTSRGLPSGGQVLKNQFSISSSDSRSVSRP